MRSTARRCRPRWGAPTSPRRRPPRFARARRSSATGGSSSAPTTSSRTWSRCGGRSASTSGSSTASRTAPMSASGTRSRIPAACRSSCSTPSSRRRGRPISASTSSAARGASSATSAAATCASADLAAAVRRTGEGPAIFDALTLREHRRPVVPLGLRPAPAAPRRGAGDPAELLQFLAAVKGWEKTPAQALDQGLHASALCADWRYPWGDSAAPLGRPRVEAPRRRRRSPGGRLLSLRPRHGARQRFHPPVPAVVADAADRTAAARREARRCRRSS